MKFAVTEIDFNDVKNTFIIDINNIIIDKFAEYLINEYRINHSNGMFYKHASDYVKCEVKFDINYAYIPEYGEDAGKIILVGKMFYYKFCYNPNSKDEYEYITFKVKSTDNVIPEKNIWTNKNRQDWTNNF